jgi:fructosamine-3-kinase
MIERIKHIMSSFFDKEAVTECEEIKSGLINATYRVKVGIKNYILQRLNIDVFANPELIQNNLDLLESYLNNHNSNYKLITPLPNKSR